MCGIIAVTRRPSTRPSPTRDELAALLDDAVSAVSGSSPALADLARAADKAAEADRLLRGLPGVAALVCDPAVRSAVVSSVAELDAIRERVEISLDSIDDVASVPDLERMNSELIRLKDAVWAMGHDRIGAAETVESLAGDDPGTSTIAAMFSLHQALSALDRLEVRGRDSAGIQILITPHGLDPDSAAVRSALIERDGVAYTSGGVRLDGDCAVFVYKAAAEIGELGDNTADLRGQIAGDALLAQALSNPRAEAQILGHTRWASVGIINEANAHPQSSEETDGPDAPFVSAVLNGDVDNFADLIASHDLRIPGGVTTDAKVIPTLTAHGLAGGADLDVAFRETVTALVGSVAIGALSAGSPDQMYFALRGSGQALYVGLAEDAFIVASEPYGVVEETDTYLRMDGETPSNPDNPTASQGQIVVLDMAHAGTVEGIGRFSYDGSALPVSEADLDIGQITTRDIDRGDFAHFLLKEITDAPTSFQKTLRGKLLETGGRFQVHLDNSTITPEIAGALSSGRIKRLLVTGQGTAAVAGQSLAHILGGLTAEADVRVTALPATELSGFGLRSDMSDTLVVAISQSGTTTDTNRTVDLIRSRGGLVVAIVNRRGSDLCDKSDGVLYTSDGRDVEMSVASTKAFYAQIAAGLLLAVGFSDLIPGAMPQSDPSTQELLSALRGLPELMVETTTTREAIAEAARQFAPSRRYWAIVGNGPNQIAAREVRIKLSELCYKSIACDATEDKKHIDLSAEPMILVCAAGLVGSTADDVGKEVAIYRAHKAAPIVIASEGATFSSALAVLRVPQTDPRLAFVLSAMVGHLFGYEAALAIDAQAQPLREARAAVEDLVSEMSTGDGADDSLSTTGFSALGEDLSSMASRFNDGLRAGEYNGHLEAGTAVRVSSLFRYATGLSQLDGYQSEFGKVGTPGVVLDDLLAGLTAGIDELTRPVDAIKHQAKTVTVGISRSDESLLEISLVAELLAAGAPRDRLSYATLRSIADLDASVQSVTGFTRYRVEDPVGSSPKAFVIDKGGVGTSLRSRTENNPVLRGTKHLVAREKELMVATGRSDGRTVLIVPETKDGETTGLALLHIDLHEKLPAATMRGVMQGYRRRYQALADAVTETEDVFRDDLLAEHSVIDLLCMPILDLADRWRT